MDKGRSVLLKYIPENAVDQVLQLIYSHRELSLKIKKSRTTKLGDYRQVSKHRHNISVNYNLNPYQFLLTLLHETAHFLTYKKYGKRVKPHGAEWKQVFGELLTPYLTPDIFPKDLLPDLLQYAKNPKASTAGDGTLYLKLSGYNVDQNKNTKYVFQLAKGDIFRLQNGQSFQLQEKRRTRYKCLNLDNKKTYLIHGNAEIFPVLTDKT